MCRGPSPLTSHKPVPEIASSLAPDVGPQCRNRWAMTSYRSQRTVIPAPTGMRLLMPLASVYLGSLAGFFLLLAAVPVQLSERPGETEAVPGLATGTLMLVSMVTGLLTPALGSRMGYRHVLVAGLGLLGLTSVAWLLDLGQLGLILISALRGAGFAAVVVGVGAVAAWSLPRERRGEGLALLGVVSTFTSLTGLPLGVWLSETVGFTVVAGVSAGSAALAVVPACRLVVPPRVPAAWWPVGPTSVRVTLRPSLLVATAAFLAGAMITHLPPTLDHRAALVLLLHTVALAASRWLVGRWSDRHGGHDRLPTVAAILIGIGGLALTAAPTSSWLVPAGAALLGVGFGAAQSLGLATMLERLPNDRVGAANAVWNAAYDVGWAAGATVVGVVVGRVGIGGYAAGVAFAVGVGLLSVTASWPAGSRTAHRRLKEELVP